MKRKFEIQDKEDKSDEENSEATESDCTENGDDDQEEDAGKEILNNDTEAGDEENSESEFLGNIGDDVMIHRYLHVKESFSSFCFDSGPFIPKFVWRKFVRDARSGPENLAFFSRALSAVLGKYYLRFPVVQMTDKELMRDCSALFSSLLGVNMQNRGTKTQQQIDATMASFGLTVAVSAASVPMLLCSELGRDFCRHFFLEAVLQTRYGDKVAPELAWSNERVRYRTCEMLFKKSISEVTPTSLLSALSMTHYVATNFPPSAAASALEVISDILKQSRSVASLSELTLLDPCSGWGGRLLGFWMSPNFSTYVGIDPNSRLHSRYAKMGEWLKKRAMFVRSETGNSAEPRMIFSQSCAEDRKMPAQLAAVFNKEKFADAVFTSPPYFNTEIYTDEPTQSCFRYKTFESWSRNFLAKMLANAAECLKKDGVIALNVKNCTSCPRLVQETFDIMVEELGFSLVRVGLMYVAKRPFDNNSKKDVQRAEVVLFFQRKNDSATVQQSSTTQTGSTSTHSGFLSASTSSLLFKTKDNNRLNNICKKRQDEVEKEPVLEQATKHLKKESAAQNATQQRASLATNSSLTTSSSSTPSRTTLFSEEEDLEDPDALLAYLRRKFPDREFRLAKLLHKGKRGVQFKRGDRWVRTCRHGRDHVKCQPCGDGNSLCEHGRRKEVCHEGDCCGSQLCEHSKQWVNCVECSGTYHCEHGIAKRRCRLCGGEDFCKHDKRISRCLICGGSGMCSIHERRKEFCRPPCGTGAGLCTAEGCDNIRVKDAFCNSCHPDYVEKRRGVSLIGCRFIDALSVELGVSIQHSHFDGKDLVRNEYRPAQMRNSPVDGFIKTENIIIEFLGDEFHGNPRQMERLKRETNLYGKLYEDLFDRTEDKFMMLAKHGYKVWYMWESEYKEFTKKKDNPSLRAALRVFDGELRY